MAKARPMYKFKKTSKFHGCEGWIKTKDEDGKSCVMVFTELSKKVKKMMVQAASNSSVPPLRKKILLEGIESGRNTKMKANLDDLILVGGDKKEEPKEKKYEQGNKV